MRRLAVNFIVVFSCYALMTVNGNVYFPATKPNTDWWSNTIIYQVYPRSFKDSNNDGIGDLKGITQKLDHFLDLGIETIWVGPIFKSPMDDMGYDTEDYTIVDPIFGTMEDFDEMVSEMNKRDLKFITDLIPNHSSYKHEWFQKSIKREGKYTDYYIWRDAKNQEEVLKNSSITPIEPNNWMSVFGGTGWTWNNERKQFYFHQFNSKQPDYNIRNSDVQQEIYNILEYWLDKGVTGFRFDALKHLFESSTFLDEPYVEGREGSLQYEDVIHIYIQNQPEDIEIIYAWREFIDDYTKRKNPKYTPIITIESYTEVNILMEYYGNSSKSGAQVPFNLPGLVQSIDKNNIVSSIDNNINDFLSSMPKNNVPNWVIENHDNFRTPTKYGPEMVPLFNAIKLFLPGIDVTYYGSEIGMGNSYVRSDQRQDPNNAGGLNAAETRDGERNPMQWDDSMNAGFTAANRSWLPVNPNYFKVNVEAQKKIPTSNYNFYKKMSQLRNTNTLKYGDLQTYNHSHSIYVLKRSLPGHETYIVVSNFGSETETIFLSDILNYVSDELYVHLGSENSAYVRGNIISTKISTDNQLKMRPQSVVVLTDKKINADKNSAYSSSESESNVFGLLCIVIFTQYFS